MKIMVGVTPERQIIIQISDDDEKILGHINLDPENARSVRDNIDRSIDIAEEKK